MECPNVIHMSDSNGVSDMWITSVTVLHLIFFNETSINCVASIVNIVGIFQLCRKWSESILIKGAQE